MANLPDPVSIFAPAIAAFPKHAAEIQQIVTTIQSEQIVPFTTNVPLNANLTDILQNAQDNFTYFLAPGTYTFPSPITIKANGITVVGKNTKIVRQYEASSSTGLYVTGKNVTITGVDFDSNIPLGKKGTPGWNAKVKVNAIKVDGENFVADSCSAHNVDCFVLANTNAKNATIKNCLGGPELRGDFVYACNIDGLNILDCTAVGSHNEHIVRTDVDGVTPNSDGPKNIVIKGCNFNNFNGKETIAIRMAAGPVLIDTCTLGAWVRAGQVSKGKPADNTVASFTMKNCHLTNKAYLLLGQGTYNTVIDSNTFDFYPSYTAIAIQGPNVTAKLTNNTKAMMAGADPKHVFYVAHDLSKKDHVVEAGTLVK